MSDSTTTNTDVSTEEFSGMTPEDRAAAIAESEGGGRFFSLPDIDSDTVENILDALEARGDGMDPDDVELPVSDEVRYIIHHATRWIGVSDMPPLFGILAGAGMWIRRNVWGADNE